jgi:hypothetical protein
VPNGKRHDNPLSDLVVHGITSFPREIESLLLRINELGRKANRYPLGEHWPYPAQEFKWAQGKDLDSARTKLSHLLAMLEAGRGDEILLNPRTGRPLNSD